LKEPRGYPKRKAIQSLMLGISCLAGFVGILLTSIPLFPLYIDVGRYEGVRALSLLFPLIIGLRFIRQHSHANALRQQLLRLESDILLAEKEFNSIFNSQFYFSKADLHSWKKKWGQLVQTVEKCVRKENVDVDFKQSVDRIIDVSQKGEKLIEERNVEFVKEEIARFKDLFDTIEPYRLTDDQRKAIVVDERTI
jgi:hypothetical protein